MKIYLLVILLDTIECFTAACYFACSIGRAEDCRSVVDILRSLVGIRFQGIFSDVTDNFHVPLSNCFIFAQVAVFICALLFLEISLLVTFRNESYHQICKVYFIFIISVYFPFFSFLISLFPLPLNKYEYKYLKN